MPRSRMQTSTVFKQLMRGHSTAIVTVHPIWHSMISVFSQASTLRRMKKSRINEVLDQKPATYFSDGTKKLVTRCGEIYIYMWQLY